MGAEDWVTLGVRPGASDEAIRQSYLDLVKVWHPDRFDGNPRLQARAQRELQRLNAAYERLRGSQLPPASPSQSPSSRVPTVSNTRRRSRPAEGEARSLRRASRLPLRHFLGGCAACLAGLVAAWLLLTPPPAQSAPAPLQPPEASQAGSVEGWKTVSPASRRLSKNAPVNAPQNLVAKRGGDDKGGGASAPNPATQASLQAIFDEADALLALDARIPCPAQPETDTEGAADHGRLTVSNGTQLDSVVVLSIGGTQKRAVCVRSGGDGTIPSISSAEYQVRFMLGQISDGTTFEPEQYFEFDRPLTFTERETGTGVEYVQASLTLHSVPGGNARTRSTAPFRLEIPVE